MRAGRIFRLAAAIALAAGGASATRLARPQNPAEPMPAHFADADNPAVVARGAKVYAAHCASCHGRYREGQPLWQLVDAYAGRRAPALDETGYTWRRSDEAIFRMINYGRYVEMRPQRVSYMPAFKDKLADREIVAVVAYIKSRWPIGLRIVQAMRNPGFAGMPAAAASGGWRLPPGCNSMFRRSDAAAR